MDRKEIIDLKNTLNLEIKSQKLVRELVYYANKGYKVKAIEFVENNLDILKVK